MKLIWMPKVWYWLFSLICSQMRVWTFQMHHSRRPHILTSNWLWVFIIASTYNALAKTASERNPLLSNGQAPNGGSGLALNRGGCSFWENRHHCWGSILSYNLKCNLTLLTELLHQATAFWRALNSRTPIALFTTWNPRWKDCNWNERMTLRLWN